MTEGTDTAGPVRAAPLVVAARGDLEWETSEDFAEAVGRALDRLPRALVVDLSEVTFTDSSALHTLYAARRRLHAAGGRLIVAGPLHPAVRRTFELSETEGLFDFAEDRDRALRSAAAGRADGVTG